MTFNLTSTCYDRYDVSDESNHCLPVETLNQKSPEAKGIAIAAHPCETARFIKVNIILPRRYGP